MKHLIVYILCMFVIISCNENKTTDSKTVNGIITDSVQIKTDDSTTTTDTLVSKDLKTNNLNTGTLKPTKVTKDSALRVSRMEVLTAIKNRDYHKLEGYIHPVDGVRFSPYGHVDTEKDIIFKNNEFVDKINQKRLKINWGSYDGSGDPIDLTIEEYFKKFVYNVDYLNAPQISVNKRIGKGNSLNNIAEAYKGGDFIESYFPGFDKSLDGMDWQSLRLVFKKNNDQYYLIGVIHDQWTI